MTLRRTTRKSPVWSILAGLAALVLSGATCPSGEAVRYICFGDSATAGLPDGSYPAYLEQLLVAYNGEQAGCVANQGQVGDIACPELRRLEERIADTMYPNAHTVLFWEGGNDLFYYLYEHYSDPVNVKFTLDHGPLPEEIPAISAIALDCIRHAAGIIRDNSLAPIVGTYFKVIPGKPITGIPGPDGLTTEQAGFVNEYVDVLNGAILAMAQAEGIPVAPIHTLGVLGGSPDYYHDGMHPSKEGYQLVAAVWYQAILAASR